MILKTTFVVSLNTQTFLFFNDPLSVIFIRQNFDVDWSHFSYEEW